jgi:hypothetical protein
LAFGLLWQRGTFLEVRVSSDPNLILKLLRKLDADIRKLDADLQGLRGEVNERFARVDERLDTLEHTVSGMASQMFFVTSFVKTVDRRVRKLEARPSR